MAHIAGDPRALHPGVAQTYDFIRDNVVRSGVVDQEIKDLCLRFVAQDDDVMEIERFEGRERVVLEWANAIVWDADLADDDLWRRLHEDFTEPELVDLGCAIGFEVGQRHFLRTIGTE